MTKLEAEREQERSKLDSQISSLSDNLVGTANLRSFSTYAETCLPTTGLGAESPARLGGAESEVRKGAPECTDGSQ